ncbi:RNA polymerase-associated protein RTF1 isoform 2 [Schistosoma japonicum]|uniref:RNA polymerase-associated protein RTF1 isoform 2 n=2 Tax=Schistosoma japonicum TaxID=6182 RepID=A0A4Z2D1U5_SCHJA|nr:RNA polymerase-associated protein RTF1 like [Schistosoma japonicum]KAH8860009.1 RNA polymerase-associated protein RTF1 like [Schistosoma japonicum]KAH8860010.1 RNA polymerase-associated protein RTF1 like [Schistosoma japonicum]TNN10475.1 RNA polymerase-associated protein RTF1 isoform 2 [Schistosoma japonicum]TNN10476.1 RNA polymerase-associated protein RTF1 isoform 2 [Schistosoma japonicum]
MAKGCLSSGSDSLDSDDDLEWLQSRRKQRKTSVPSDEVTHDSKSGGIEEGEVSSDDLDEDEDDGLDDNLIGGEDDKRRLAKMSELEREEELFKRAERRDAIRARKAVKQKLKERREKEKAQQAASSGHFAGDVSKSKRSAYHNVFSDSDEAENSDSSGLGPKGLRQRKIALEKKKVAHRDKFQELIERRKQQAAKKRRIDASDEVNMSGQNSDGSSSDSDDESSKPHAKIQDKHQSMSQRVFSSDASDSSDSSRPGSRPVARRSSFSSSSGSQRSGSSSEDDARGRSRSPEEELVSSIEHLSRIRLSRFKMEKWVHMPFFDDLIKGCFVRINIGLHQGVPIYRCAEIVDVVETPKIYDLGDTRTNKGIVVRVGKDQSTFRLAFISNSEFQQDEFDSWMRRVQIANMKPPTLNFVRDKVAEITEAINRPIRDERVVEQIIQSKRRFQKAPTNFALRKAELIKQREQAEADGDTELLKNLDIEIEEIESQAERIERRRTLGFKSITSINQRNRALSVQQAEEAIRKESEEALNSKEEDPFTRVHSQPVIVTKKYLENLRHKRLGVAQPNAFKDSCDLNQSFPPPSTPDSELSLSSRQSLLNTPMGSNSLLTDAPDSVCWSLGDDNSNLSTPHDSLHAIHNFEINIDLDLDGNNDQSNSSGRTTSANPDVRHSTSPRSRGTTGNSHDVINGSPQTPVNGPFTKPNRRLLNLQEYKKRHGLI